MAKNINSKIEKSILICDGITAEQNLLEAILLGESRESALKKAENIIECLIHDYKNHYDFINHLDAVIKNNPIGALTLFALLTKHIENEFSIRAQISAQKWHENNPKQQALDEIHEHYKNQKNQFKRRGFTAEFVREMHNKYPVITDIKTIQRLVASLNKENELIPR